MLIHSLGLLPVHFLSFLCTGRNVVSQLPGPDAMPCLLCRNRLPSGSISQNKLLFKLLLVTAFSHSNRKEPFLPYVASVSKAMRTK